MGGGPKASAANLEPLGKRRRFGNPADYSSTKACASPAHEVRSVNDMAPISSCAKDSRSAPLLSTAQTTTSHTESKVNATLSDTASAQVGKPSVSYLPNAEPPSSTTGTAATGPIVNRRNVKDSHEPIKRAPSPRTRLETSARALALAQEWQAKFKALPKKPPMPYSLHQVITREQSVRMVNERSMLNKPVPQPSPFGKSELQGRDSIATGEIDEEPRKRRRKSGPESQASAANLEPLGGSRRGYFPNTSADGSPNLSGFQQQSSQVTPVDMPALGIQKPKPDVSVDAVGLSRSTQHIPVDLETVAAPKNLTTKAEDVGRSAAREFQCPLPPRNDTHLPTRNEKTGNEKTGNEKTGNEKTGNEKAGDDDRFEDDFRKRKRTRSPYRPRDDYKEAGHREDPDQRHDSSRDRLLSRARFPTNSRKELTETHPRGSQPSLASGARNDPVTHSERARAPARYQNEREDIEDYSNRDRRLDSRLRDYSFRERSFKRSHSYLRDRSASPRRSHHDRQSNRDHARDRGDDHLKRGENDLHSHNGTELRSWADYQDLEYRHRDTRYSYDEASRSARYERGHHQQSRSSDQYLRSEHRLDYRGDSIHPVAGKHQDDRRRARDFNRR
ncbi:hypothetical protein PMIN02_002816 [Paraphaeosphaeria minitans]